MIVRRSLGAVISVFPGVSWNFNALGGGYDMPWCSELCYTQISYHSYVYILSHVILTLRLYDELTCTFS